MLKIAVLGERESVIGYTALGLKVFCVATKEEAESEFKRAAKSGEYAIIYVTESFAPSLADEIEKYKEVISPAVILIPGANGATGIGNQSLDQAVEKAVGANII